MSKGQLALIGRGGDSFIQEFREGTGGRGLPLTEYLVSQYGGRLQGEAEAGLGTTITAIFPAERLVKAGDAPVAGARKAG